MPSHSLFEHPAHGSLSSKIFELLRERIVNEEYEKGQKLNELALANELKISRTPIREALKQLELEGLVESIPNKGVYVKGFSLRDIDDMFEVRISLESLGIRLAIERMDDEHYAKIKEVFELMEFYTMKKDQEKVDDLNILFHETIYQATQSQYLETLLKDIHFYVSITSRHLVSQYDRMASSLEEHRAILNAIEARDATLAYDTMQQHIKKTQLLVRAYYANKN